MFGGIGQFFSVTTRFNALVFDFEARPRLARDSDYKRAGERVSWLPKIEQLVRSRTNTPTLEAETHRLIS